MKETPGDSVPSSSVTIILGFLLLGFTTGFLTGMSSSPLAVSMIALLFALSGGSAITLLTKLSGKQISLIGALLFAVSLGTLVGCCSGIVVSENHLLTFRRSATSPVNQPAQQAAIGTDKYLKAMSVSQIQILLNQWQDGLLTEPDAKAKIREIVSH